MAERIADVWGERTPYADAEWTQRIDEHVVEPPDRWVQSACVLCSHGCALDVGVKGGRMVGVRGRAVDRVNRGRLGPKGLYGWSANSASDRLTRPLVRRDGKLVETSWDEALGAVVGRSKEALAKYGSGSLGFYCTGQLMLEEYYALAQIARAGIGTPHVDGNTRLCTATAASALIESFGSDGDPGTYSDYDTTDAIFMVGHNMAETQTVLWSRILDRRRGPRPPRLIVVDPRTTPTAKEADIHLAPRLGTNVALLNGLINLIIEAGNIDRQFIDARTVGYDKLVETVAKYPPSVV